MSDVTLSGYGVVSGTLRVPRVGNWIADLIVDTDTAPSGRVSLDLFGATWSGTVLRAGGFAGRFSVTVVGGGGLWKKVQGKSYGAVPLSLPLQEILTAGGEALASAPPASKIAGWTRFGAAAERCLSQLLEGRGLDWRVQPDGKVWVGAETWPAAEPFEYTIIDSVPAEHRMEIAGESALPLPGTVFEGQRVSSVLHTLTASKWRTVIRFEDPDEGATEDKMRQAIVSIVEDTMRGVDWLARYVGKVVVTKSDGTVDVMMEDQRFGPSGLNAKVRFLPGCEVTLAPGAGVLIGFEGGDSAHPFAEPNGTGGILKIVLKAQSIEIEATTLKLKGTGTASLDGPSVAVGGTALDVRLGKGTNFVAALGDPVTPAVIGPGPLANTVVKV